jgi:plastocyanin
MNPFRTLQAACCIGFLAAAGCSQSNSSMAVSPVGPVSWQLSAGTSSTQEALQGLNFYPSSITIDVGDTIRWAAPAVLPHTVTFLGPNASLPSPSDPTSQQPAGGPTFDGSVYTSSGFMQAGQTYALTFTKPGTYKYYCIIHNPEMSGTVTVQAAGMPYPNTQVGLTSQGQASILADLTAAANAVTTFPYSAGGPHLVAGIAPGLGLAAPANATVLRFLDGPNVTSTSSTIPVGTTVTWTNQGNNEPHTVTFPVAGQGAPQLAPTAPASGGTTYTGAALTNSGVIASGASYTLTFTQRGTFTYYCLFHANEGMTGTIVVQ